MERTLLNSAFASNVLEIMLNTITGVDGLHSLAQLYPNPAVFGFVSSHLEDEK